MERKVQERLIGAVVLVVLGVWLIPWILDGQEMPASSPVVANQSTIELPTPNSTGPGREPPTRTIEIEVTSNLSDTDAAEAPDGGVSPKSTANGDGPSVTGTRTNVISRAALQPGVEEDSARRSETVEASPSLDSQSRSLDGWMVQLGSFGDEDNARRQADRVESFGYKPVISNFVASGRSMYRVRLGPHATRGEAEAVASALSVHGFVSQVVAAN